MKRPSVPQMMKLLFIVDRIPNVRGEKGIGMAQNVSFRFASEQDASLILSFIKGLAVYEKMEDQVVATPELLRHWLFEQKKAEVVFALLDGKEVGFCAVLP